MSYKALVAVLYPPFHNAAEATVLLPFAYTPHVNLKTRSKITACSQKPTYVIGWLLELIVLSISQCHVHCTGQSVTEKEHNEHSCNAMLQGLRNFTMFTKSITSSFLNLVQSSLSFNILF